ncbi:MAG: acetate--CoA ligase family protein [Halanaeroarchaeum sp.]
MGDPVRDRLLSPNRVAVVGSDELASTPSLPHERFEPAELREESTAERLEDTDLALVTTASDVEAVVGALVEGGVRAILVSAAVDPRTWADLLEVATDADVPLLGPEASLARPEIGLQVGIDEEIQPGSTALVAEDSLTVSSLVAEATRRGIELGTVLATGSESTVRPADTFASFDAGSETDVILALPDRIDRPFFDATAALSTETAIAVHAPKWACADEPVDAGALGSIAPGHLRDTVLEQAGALGVDSVDRLLDLAPALAHQPLPDGDDVVIVSNAGGPGVMATDAVGASRLSMANLDETTVEALEAAIPDRAYARNPLDLLADSDIDVFSDVLDAVLTDSGVDAAVVISAPNPLFTFEEMAEIVADARSRHESPVVTALMGGESTAAAASRLRSVGIPNYFDPFQAVAVIDALATQRDAAQRRTQPTTANVALPAEKLRAEIEAAAGGLEVLEAAGLPIDAVPRDVSVSVHATRIPTLGPVVAVGVTDYGSVLQDVAVRVAPPTAREVRAMFEELRASQLLKGARGMEAVDVEGLVDAVRRIAAMPDAVPAIRAVHATVAAGQSGVGVTDATVSVGDHQ